MRSKPKGINGRGTRRPRNERGDISPQSTMEIAVCGRRPHLASSRPLGNVTMVNIDGSREMPLAHAVDSPNNG